MRFVFHQVELWPKWHSRSKEIHHNDISISQTSVQSRVTLLLWCMNLFVLFQWQTLKAVLHTVLRPSEASSSFTKLIWDILYTCWVTPFLWCDTFIYQFNVSFSPFTWPLLVLPMIQSSSKYLKIIQFFSFNSLHSLLTFITELEAEYAV